MAQQVSTNTFGCAKWIVSSDATQGTHTTIASALTSASSGDTIFIRPGTYTENLTLKVGVNLTAFGSDSSLSGSSAVIISGNATLSTAGSVTISGIQLQTNSAAFLTVSGSVASIVNLKNCYLNCSNATGISFSSSSASSQINIFDCYGNIGTTGISLYSSSSAGLLYMNNCNITNTGAATTASSNSAGAVLHYLGRYQFPLSCTSTGQFSARYTNIDTSSTNTTSLTLNGTGTGIVGIGSGITFSSAISGTASSVSVGTGVTGYVYHSECNSTNTNVITGAGTVTVTGLILNASGKLTNPTTQLGGAAIGLTQGTAPSAGYIGEQISSAATTVAMSNGIAKTITSISLTPGIWDISTIFSANGSTANITDCSAGPSTVNNTQQGNLGDQYGRVTSGGINVTSAYVPQFRATLSSTTTYYLVAVVAFASGTMNGQGRITATRVG